MSVGRRREYPCTLRSQLSCVLLNKRNWSSLLPGVRAWRLVNPLALTESGVSLNWKYYEESAPIFGLTPKYDKKLTSNSAPAIHFHPPSSALLTTSAKTPLGSTSRCFPVSGVMNLNRKKGMFLSQFNRRYVERSIEASKSRYPFALFDTRSSLEYVESWTTPRR